MKARSVSFFCFCISLFLFSTSVFGVSITSTLDGTAPVSTGTYQAVTGVQTGRLNRFSPASSCGSVKPNPGNFSTTGSRQFDQYRFVALSSGCVTVTLSNAGDNVLFSTAYDSNGLNTSDTSLNYLADMAASPTTGVPVRSYSFDVVAGQIFNIVVNEVDVGGGIGQSYDLDVSGVKLAPDFSISEVLDTSPPQEHPAYFTASGSQTGRLNRFSPASNCGSLKPNPGLFSATGSRRADLYIFVPASSGCATVTLSHTGSDSAQIVAYNQNGFNPGNPSTNYLADPGQSAINSTVVFSFLVTRGVPVSLVVHEVNPSAGIGDNYTLNISNVSLTPNTRIVSRLDATPPTANPEFIASTGVQTGRLNRFPPVADCNAPKASPGLFTATGARSYDLYRFTPASSGCVEVTLRSFGVGFDFYAVAYNSAGFNPADPSANYLADHGNSPNSDNPRTFSFDVQSGIPFYIAVHEVNPGGAVGSDYQLEVGGIALDITPRAKTADFDGDFHTDASIFRPSVGEWWYLRSSNNVNNAFQFGAGTDKIVPADFTGDGVTDIAFFRPSSGSWFVLRSEDFSFYSFPFGQNGDIPAPGDFDADGKADPTIFRPSNSTWYILRSTGGTTITQFGAIGDKPVAADYDGDNVADLAIFRPSNGQWWINRSQAGLIVTTFGTSTDTTVQADYTGDGRTDAAFWRPGTGEWFVLRSEDYSFYSFPFGQNGDTPSTGDFDGDGVGDPAVFRGSNATWYLLQSTNGFSAVGFGAAGDIPLPSAYNR